MNPQIFTPMKPNHHLTVIRETATALLNLDIHTDEQQIEEKINTINASFQELTGIYGRDIDLEHLACLPAKAGLALSLNHAASCVVDYKRTVKFFHSLVMAIKDKQQQNPEKTVEIFYAGCGPFAPFITMVAPLFSPKEVQFSLLEINKKSLEKAEELIQKLNLEDYVQTYHLADAITFEIPNAAQVDIVFTETLDALLFRECYVPILWNILPQLSESATIIPDNVVLKLNFKDQQSEVSGGTIFNTREVLKVHGNASLPERFEATNISLSEAEQYDSVILDTEVQIYKDVKLTRSESSLTLALEIPIEKPVIHETVAFTYQITPQPSLQYSVR